MARVFSGATDSVATGLTAHNAQRTYLIWAYQTGSGGGALGRMWEKRSGADAQVELLYAQASVGIWSYGRNFSGAAAQWSVGLDTPISLNVWHQVVISYDSSDIVNKPVIWIDGVKRSLVTETAPLGTANTNTSAYILGNRTNDNARNWAGSLAEFAVWNSFVSDADVVRLFTGLPAEQVAASGLVAYYRMSGGQSPEPDSTGLNAAGTVTGTVLGAGPDWLTRLGPQQIRK